MYKNKCLIFLLFLGWYSVAWAGNYPPVLKDLSAIQTVDANQMMGFMESGEVLIIDARKKVDFTNETIPTSVHCNISDGSPVLTDIQIDQAVQDMISCTPVFQEKRARKVVAFCNGLNCWRSSKSVLALKKMGFEQVFWYRLGMNDWKERGLPLE